MTIDAKAFSDALIKSRRRKGGEIIGHGVYAADIVASRNPGPSSVIISNIPHPPTSKITWGVPGLTLFYGRGGNVARGEYAKTLVRQQKVALPIAVTIDCGTILASDVSLPLLPSTGLIRSNYIAMPVEDLLVGYWRTWLKEDGYTERELALMDWRNQAYIALRPDLIPRLSTTLEFAHLKAFSWIGNYGKVRANFLTVLQKNAIKEMNFLWFWKATTKVKLDPSLFPK